VDAKFSFEIDRSLGLVRITMAGFYTREDIEAFLAARQEAQDALGWPPNSHLTVNDIRGMAAQPQTTVDAFCEMLAAPEYRSRRLAFVVGPYLARTQVLRALASRAGKCFTDPEAAEAWLLADETDAVPHRAAG
jgi:hypothetical protein